MSFLAIFLLVLSAFISASGQLLLKRGSQFVAQKFATLQEGEGFLLLIKKLFITLTEPHIMIALTLYVIGVFTWLKVLSQSNLSMAYPILISMTIAFTTFGAFFLLHEPLTFQKWLGIFFVIGGIFLLTYAKG